MPSLNKILLIGNVGRDPEVRYLDQGSAGQSTKVATFTLATTDRYRDRSGELRESTEWHNLVLWRQLADLAEKYIRKGSQIYVEGRIRNRSYTDQQGQKKYITEVVADNVQLLGRRDGEPGGFDPAPAPAPAPSYQRPAPAAPVYQAPPAYQQPAYQPPVQQPAPAPSVPGLAPESGEDDLPF